MFAFVTPVSAVVISEIHYNPAGGNDGLEFIELANDTTTPEDISGYQFVSGVAFEIPAATVLGKGATVVVCADVDLVRATYGIDNAIGNFVGRLDGSGERLTLVSQAGIELQSVRFRDEGKWPTAPDGTGHSLVLRDADLDSSEPESWTWSPELGGSPGRRNFPDDGPRFEETTVFDVGEEWRFKRGNEAFSNPANAWREPAFDDAGWERGVTGIGYGDGDDATELNDMRNGYTTVAMRKRFTVTAEDLAQPGEYVLGIVYDDGFCAFVNGAEVATANCDASLDWDDTSTGSHEANDEEFFAISRGSLVAGDNLISILAVNFSLGSSDLSNAPRLIRRRLVDEDGGARPPIVFNELGRDPGVGEGFVELYNHGETSADVSGFLLTDDPERPDPYELPAGSVLAPGGFLAVDESTGGFDLSAPEVRVFLVTASGLVAAAATFDTEAPPDLVGTAWSELRYPDGGNPDWISATSTPNAPNEVEATPDLVINEIHYHPPERRLREFIELFNKGDTTIDLAGYSFDKGIRYEFQTGDSIGPGEYVVVAQSPEDLEATFGITGVHGPYEGRLADGGENLRFVDPWDNPVDEVRYFDGGRWSEWADGRGSSLELIDARHDNSVASAWEASDEDGKSEWEELTYSVPAYRRSSQSELHLFLVERGRCLIDDISIRRGGGANHVRNGGFESNTSSWRIQGTHVDTRRVTWDSHSGNGSLELRASGKGDTGVNRIEADTSPALSNGPYDVVLWARWLRGSSLLIGHGEFTSGPWGGRPGPSTNLSGNTLGGKFRLTVPRNLGTPGAENSVTAKLRDETGSGNLGPVLSGVRHGPASPAPNAAITFEARVSDPDGVDTVTVRYRTRTPNGAFASADLLDNGQDGDRRAGDGIYGGQISGYATGTKVVFYVEAEDTRGATRRFPRDATSRTLLLQVQGPLDGSLDTARWVLDDARDSLLRGRPLHSNDLLDGTFVFNNDEVYYNIGARYRGSPWGRPGRSNFRIAFPKDDRFHRGRTAINLSSRGGSPNEGSAYFLVGRNGVMGSPAPTADYFWVRHYYNGASQGRHGLFQPVDGDYMTKWYGSGDHRVLKANGRLAFNDGGSRTGWDGASYTYMNDNTESYRAYFFHTIHQTLDDWEPFLALARVMDRGETSNASFDRQITGILDLEAWLRVISVRILIGGWDAFSIGNGHNGYLSYDGNTGKWGILPFDMDNSFGQSGFPFFPTADGDVARMMGRPWSRRVYFRILSELLDGYWNVRNVSPFLETLQRDVGIGTGGIRNFINARSGSVRSTINASVNAAFRIRTNSGDDFEIDEETVRLEGDAPVTVAQILVDQGGNGFVALEPTWVTQTRWRVDFELAREVTEFQFIGVDGSGETVETATITVTTTELSTDPDVSSWTPRSGDVMGGYEVTFTGRNLAEGTSVFFGEARAQTVDVDTPERVRVVAPRAAPPLPENGVVDIRLVLTDGSEVLLEDAFEYQGTLPDVFLRGDGNRDFVIDVSDPVQTLFHLYRGASLGCPDAADFDDSGALDLTDAVGLLDYIFRDGPSPAAPFPVVGVDPTADELICE